MSKYISLRDTAFPFLSEIFCGSVTSDSIANNLIKDYIDVIIIILVVSVTRLLLHIILKFDMKYLMNKVDLHRINFFMTTTY